MLFVLVLEIPVLILGTPSDYCKCKSNSNHVDIFLCFPMSKSIINGLSLSLANLYVSYKKYNTITCSLVSVFRTCWLITSWAQACSNCCCRLITHNLHLHLHNKLSWKQWIKHVFQDKRELNSLLSFTWVEQEQWHHIIVFCVTVCHVSSSTKCKAMEMSAWWHRAAPGSFDFVVQESFRSTSGLSGMIFKVL